ncbi:MAG: hypothetical protein IJ426_05415 [Clostridia bacterium]|nr:hypothetical protein [Clostridia bacterium]
MPESKEKEAVTELENELSGPQYDYRHFTVTPLENGRATEMVNTDLIYG